MNNTPPTSNDFTIEGDRIKLSGGANNWLQQVWLCLSGMKRTINQIAVIDFGSISAQSQLSTTVTVLNAKVGDVVIVQPPVDTSGVFYTGVITATGVATVYAKNFTAGAINPPSGTYRLLVIQN